jgi:ParB-like chromosome segregation protein Spo0J
MKTEILKIKQIKANPDNPRVIKDGKFQKLVQSIKDFPRMMEIRPIVVNADNMVLGGNMRLKACIEIGLTELPVLRVEDLTAEQQREFIIKDNSAFGEWDWELLANQWDALQLEEWGLDIPQWEKDENYGTDFSLPDGDKAPFQPMTFTLADEQAVLIQNAISEIKQTEEYK